MNEASRRDRYRASDVERERVAAWLAIAFEEGRLDLAEYDRRVQAAYTAVTYGDLAVLTHDLPPSGAPLDRRNGATATAAPENSRPAAQAVAVGIGLLFVAMCIARTGSIAAVAALLLGVGVLVGLVGLCRPPYGRSDRRN